MAMTSRLYYDDSYTTDFMARVVEQTAVGDRPAVALDRTYFYPTGGGQPFDTGMIGGVAVLDVITRPEDHIVLHILGGEVAPGEMVTVFGSGLSGAEFRFEPEKTGSIPRDVEGTRFLVNGEAVGILSLRNWVASAAVSPRYGARIPSSGLTTGGL